MQRDVCAICGDPVLVAHGEEDVVCTPCFEANLRGGVVLERPTVAHLADLLPVRRRELKTLDCARWPLTQGRSEG